jgi:CBS domain-containing membrane protein
MRMMSTSIYCPISDVDPNSLPFRNATREHAGPDHVGPLLQRLRVDWLVQRFPPRMVRALYVFVNSFVTIGVLAVLALVSRNPFVFPSLGPTAYLLFFSPLAKASSPRNTILGHAIGLVCGYAAFVVTGAGALPFGVHSGVFWPRILAAALSLAATGACMVLFEVSHPPAGATTLIVSLGIIWQPRELVIIEVAVLILVAQALVINRLAGLPYPWWSSSTHGKTKIRPASPGFLPRRESQDGSRSTSIGPQ